MIKNGKIWPVMIAVSIFGVVLLGYWTIKETLKADISESNAYMAKYQTIDENINDYIYKRIAFNKKYNLKLKDFNLNRDNSFIEYQITTKDNKPVDNAKLKLVISRPTDDAKDIEVDKYNVKNGIYRFENIKLPKEGRWDLILKVSIGNDSRFYNIKADTRNKHIKEF
jgi:nitrogen fixation protein FixH